MDVLANEYKGHRVSFGGDDHVLVLDKGAGWHNTGDVPGATDLNLT